MNRGWVYTALFLATGAQAQTIYKCVAPNGSVIYSQRPCGANAQLLSRETKKAAPESDGDPPSTNSSRNADKHSPDTNIQAISDSVEDSNCRRAAQRLEIYPSTSEIDNLKAQVYELEHSHYIGAVTGSVTANSQRMEQEDRIRAASLRATIATKEQQNSSIHLESQSAARAALAKCDTEKADRDKARANLSE